MPSTRDLLQRFRPAPTPGAATAAGVPVDRRDERAQELACVFDELAATTAEAQRLRRAAEAEADRRRDQAEQDATARIATARLGSDPVRAQAVAEARQRLEVSAGENDAAAEQRAREIEHEADRTRSEDVAAVVASVRARVLQRDREGAPA